MSKQVIQNELVLTKQQKIAELERKQSLPHLYGFPWYEWAWDFFTATDKLCLLTAANQLSKSSTQIRKMIHWATDKSLWPRLWRSTPQQFWYLYPDSNLATSEFEMKWVKEFLPRGKMKDDPQYGWKAVYKQAKKIDYIDFNSGIRLYFKTYEQDVHALQGSSVHYISCDEELPSDLYSELMFRTAATNGYFSMVFTATRAQEFWREAMEEIGSPFERFRGAWKRQVSMYESMEYMDGSPSPWSYERIKEVEASCKDENEVLRRVYGRFVRSDGRRFVFTKRQNMKPALSPEEYQKWYIFTGVDPGAGKTKSKAAICFIAVRSDFQYARVFRGWRGDDQVTTAGDIFKKYMDMKGSNKVLTATYDFSGVDFGTIAEREGEPFIKAEKNRAKGDELLNTLFKYHMMDIDEGDPELEKLANELVSLGKESEEGDDFADALRYAVLLIPFDFSQIRALEKKEEVKKEIKQERDLREQVIQVHRPDDSMESEMNEWASMY